MFYEIKNKIAPPLSLCGKKRGKPYFELSVQRYEFYRYSKKFMCRIFIQNVFVPGFLPYSVKKILLL